MQLTEISFPVATDCVFRNCLVNNFRVFSISCFMRVNFAQCSLTLARRLGGFDSEVFFFVWKPRTRLPGFVKVFLVFCVDCPQNCMRGLEIGRSGVPGQRLPSNPAEQAAGFESRTWTGSDHQAGQDHFSSGWPWGPD